MRPKSGRFPPLQNGLDLTIKLQFTDGNVDCILLFSIQLCPKNKSLRCAKECLRNDFKIFWILEFVLKCHHPIPLSKKAVDLALLKLH